MPSTLIPARVLCGLRFASRLLPGLHIREDHPRRNRHAEPCHDHSGDRGGPAGETGSAAGGGPDAQAARVPGISPNTARAALAGDGPPRGARRPAWSVADEAEPRAWPYRLPAGWRRITELDRPAVSAQKCRDGRQDRHRLPGPGRRAGLPDPGADSATGSVADEVEPRVWPYVLPAGWRRVTELDGPAVSAQKCRDGSQDGRRLPGPGRRAGLPDPGADSATLRDAEPRAGRARPRRILDPRGVLPRLHDIVAGI